MLVQARCRVTQRSILQRVGARPRRICGGRPPNVDSHESLSLRLELRRLEGSAKRLVKGFGGPVTPRVGLERPAGAELIDP
jgi:hypothetical protein